VRGYIDSLVLCDPIVSGEGYIRELKELHKQMLRFSYVNPVHNKGAEGPLEFLGFSMDERLLSEIKEINLLKIHKSPADKIFMFVNEDQNDAEGLKERLKYLNSRTAFSRIAGPKIWMEEPNKGLVPRQLLDSLVSCISEVYA